ncbi:MAG: D-glycero-beta-D-manno-heptose 1-phosphate adenylyltransferase [Pyrinomonadaceae bacterium]
MRSHATERYQPAMEKVVFTNGCFDLIHPGHVDLLRRARELGTKLIVGINSDASVRGIKGPKRPLMGENERAAVLLGIRYVDDVVVFDESTPERLIREIAPDVLVKGGDWKPDEIVGSDFVLQYGGEVHSLPLLGDYSSTAIAEKFSNDTDGSVSASTPHDTATKSLEEHLSTFQELLTANTESIRRCAALIVEALRNGGKVLICGNGGSAADAQHIAAEFVGRYETERRSLPAIALTTDTSALTAISNDYGFDKVFERQVSGLAAPGDVLIAISTSGNSPNINAAVMRAREIGCATIGLTGAGGKKLAGLCDNSVLVPSTRTARIQEAHITIGHIWCEIVDREFAEIVDAN